MIATSRFKALAAAAGIAVAGLSVQGCGSAADTNTDAAGGVQVSSSPTATISLQRVKDYASQRELNRDAQLIVRATAGRPVDDTADKVARFSLTTMSVTKVLKGAYAGSTLVLRQTGGTGLVIEGAPVVTEGQEYLLWLTPTQRAGDPPDWFYPIGAGAGIYAIKGDTATRTDPESPKLPASVNVDLAARAAAVD